MADLNIIRYNNIVYQDSTMQTTATAPNLGNLPGQLNENQLPTVIGAGSSLNQIDAGTY